MDQIGQTIKTFGLRYVSGLIAFCCLFYWTSENVGYIPNGGMFFAFLLAYAVLRYGFMQGLATLIVSVVYLSAFHVWRPITAGATEKALFWFAVFSAILAMVTHFKQAIQKRERASAESLTAARDGEEKMHRLADTMPQIVWMADGRGSLDYFNQQFHDYTGLSFDEAKSSGWRPIIHPDDHPKTVEAWKKSLAEGSEYYIELRIKRADGEYRWFLGRSSPLRDKSGTIYRWVGTNTDIHDQKQMLAEAEKLREELAEKTNLFETVLEQMPSAVIISDARSGAIVFSNSNIATVWRHPLIPSKNVEEYGQWIGFHPDGRRYEGKDWPLARSLVHGEIINGEDTLVLRGDGTRGILCLRSAPVRDKRGEITAAVVICDDVTAEREAFETARKLSAIVESSTDAITTTDQWGIVQSWNQAAENLFHITAEQTVGSSILALLPESHRAQEDQVRLQLIEKKSGSVTAPVDFVLKDGGTLHLMITMFPVLDGAGNVTSIARICRNITDLKRVEQARTILEVNERAALAASKLKSDFLANMSHEIRTPLNGIIGMTDFLIDTPLTIEQRDYAQTAQASASSLLTIVNDILDFSKIEAGKLEIEALEFSLNTLLTETEKMFAPAARSKKVEFRLDIPEFRSKVHGDPGRIRQILNNLLSNAIKFSENGQVALSAKTLMQDAHKIQVRFDVRDSGIGMSKETSEKLFEPFMQAEVSTTRKYGGTGLGLSIAKRLTDLMGGSISVQSELGQGSTFSLTLPFMIAGLEESVNATDGVATSPVLTRPTQRILVVEDNPVNQKIALAMLEKLGYRAHAVGNGKEAVEAIGRGRYDIVLMDCQMPEMDGYEASRTIRLAELGGQPAVTIIAMTANALKGDREKCLQAGMDDYVTKPIRLPELKGVIEKNLVLSEERSA